MKLCLLVLLFLPVFVCLGCSGALPKGNPEVQISEALTRAEVAAEQAKKEAARAEAEAARSQKMLRDAQEALAKATAANQICSDLNARIPKNVKPRVVYIEKKVEEGAEVPAAASGPGAPGAPAGASAPGVPAATPVPTPIPGGFSRSDAPGGTYQRGGSGEAPHGEVKPESEGATVPPH